MKLINKRARILVVKISNYILNKTGLTMFKKGLLFVILATSFVAYSQVPTYYNDVDLNLTGLNLKTELATV